ncbi:TraG family conjugative transposon ATPase [Sphingobacterium phlebotomi]|uniref:TraG family conjugative transposon ATPase n=2 Tax=Sphingobacterium phlebotomi TaxID=2605433 RepID=A0A5D4HAF6_9SPHI|nr:TraG family conjugative transposon ATPase [Sphingobacterium phlebotomi]
MVLAGVVLAAVILQSKTPSQSGTNLEDMLPIWKVENDCVLSKKGDVTLAFKLTLPEIFTLSREEYDALHHIWLKAIKVLPTGTIMHKQDWFVKAKYQADFEGEANFLKRSELYFHERPYLAHECYLMLTLKAQDRKPQSSATSTLLRKGILPQRVNDEKYLRKLLDSVGQFRSILSDSSFITLEQLKEEELIGTKEKRGFIEKYIGLADQNESIQQKDIVFKPDMTIGKSHVEMYSMSDVEDMPTTCSPTQHFDKYSTDKTKFAVGFATPVGHLLPVNHIYNQYMVVEDTSKTLKKMEAKQRRLQSLATYSRENAISMEATQDFLNEAISESRTPIKAHFNLICWTDSKDELNDIRNQTASALAKMDIVPHLETSGAPQLWWAGIPGNAAEIPENECFETFAEQAACFLNMETTYRSSKSPFGIRLGDRLSGLPLHVDISDEPMKGIITNRNKLVAGSSGSGKSMFMNHLLHSYVLQNAHCVVIDVGHSYTGLCELLGGYYFTYSEDNPIKFNPFFLAEGEILDTEKKESIKTLLVALWKQNDETFRRSEYVAISNALQSYYKFLQVYKEIFACFDTFYEFLQREFVKELKEDNVKDRDFDMNNFLYVLRPFYKGGEFDYLLNAKENLDMLNQRFVVIELDNIKDHPILFPIVTLITMSLFISKMRKLKGVRKVIVIEEAWKAIAQGGMAEFMKYLYKTVRKHFGEAITVTQEIDDIIGNPVVRDAIINNADCKIILDMKKFQNKFDGIQQALGMTDKGRDLVLSINRANDPNYRYREVYIELGNQLMTVYRYEPSPLEYYAYSTEQTEKVKVQEYAKKYGSILKGLVALTSELKEN